MKKLILLLALAALSLPAALRAQEPAPDNSRYILTPAAPVTPRINGPKIYGARPGADFLYRIPTTGERPIAFSAKGLPKGLKLDKETGIIRGTSKKRGTYKVTLRAENRHGRCEREFRIVIGDKIALTPPMGWNSWNCWGNSVSQEKVMSSAKAMLEKGLADYGWTYINIDDGWQGLRGGKYNLHNKYHLNTSIYLFHPFSPLSILLHISFYFPNHTSLYHLFYHLQIPHHTTTHLSTLFYLFSVFLKSNPLQIWNHLPFFLCLYHEEVLPKIVRYISTHLFWYIPHSPSFSH